MTVPYTFSGATSPIPLSQLDANFATPVTIGNTAVTLGNTVTTLNNLTLANVAITSTVAPISVALGGTGLATISLNGVMTGNAAGSVVTVAPGTSGNVLTSNGSLWASQSVPGGITRGTAVATTSGTSIDFTGIPATAKRITVMFGGVSTNGTSIPIIQIGAGSVQNTGYTAYAMGGSGNISSTIGFPLVQAGNIATLMYGSLVLVNPSGNLWVETMCVTESGFSIASQGAGGVTLGSVLDRLRLTTTNGTDTFDAGSVNIMWE